MISRRFLPIVLAASAVLGACGSSDDSSSNADDGAAPAESEAAPVDDAEAAEPESSGDAGGSGTATMTIADGTVYEFAMSTCETSNNVDFFLVDPGYDLFGSDENGFRLQLIRAIPDGGALGSLEGGFDENGVNPSISYIFREPDSVITLDGNTVTGDLDLDGFISQEKIHGDDTTASLTVSC